MRTTMQISLDSKMKTRLKRFKVQTSISISKVIKDALEKHLPVLEAQHKVQEELPLDESEDKD